MQINSSKSLAYTVDSLKAFPVQYDRPFDTNKLGEGSAEHSMPNSMKNHYVSSLSAKKYISWVAAVYFPAFFQYVQSMSIICEAPAELVLYVISLVSMTVGPNLLCYSRYKLFGHMFSPIFQPDFLYWRFFYVYVIIVAFHIW